MKKSIFKIIYVSYGIRYEIYARKICQSNMFGFIEIEDFIFGEKSSVVVDPGEERLKNELSDVSRSYIPVHSVVRIDEVTKEGISIIKEISDGGNKVSPFPGPFYTPPAKDK